MPATIPRMKKTAQGLLPADAPEPEQSIPLSEPATTKQRFDGRPMGKGKSWAESGRQVPEKSAPKPKPKPAKPPRPPKPAPKPPSRPAEPAPAVAAEPERKPVAEVIALPAKLPPAPEPVRVDTHQQPAPEPTQKPIRVAQPSPKRPAGWQPMPVNPSRQGQNPESQIVIPPPANTFNRAQFGQSAPKASAPSDRGDRWIEPHVKAANSRTPPPVVAGRLRKYQAGPFWTDSESLRISLPDSEFASQQARQELFKAQHGDRLAVVHPDYTAACAAADEAAKLLTAMAPRPTRISSEFDVFDDDF